MNKKKGFTLIELLAIIVILAIIAVVTVPLILNIINDAQKNASIDSAYGYKSALEKYYMKKVVENTENELPNGYKNISELPEDFIVSGESPSEGWVKLKKGIVQKFSLKYNDYVVTMDNDKNVTSEKQETIEPHVIGNYQEVEYLESTGTQYIDTGISGESKWKITNQYITPSNTSQILVGCGTAAGQWFGQYNEKYAIGTGSIHIFNVNSTTKQNLSIEFTPTKVSSTINDETKNREGSFTNNNYYLFGGLTSSSGNFYSYTRVYSTKTYQNNETVRNFVPVIRKSDNKPGMLDLANYSRNLFSSEWEQGVIESNNGASVNTSNSIRTKDFISVIPNKHYAINRSITSGYMNVRGYDKDKNYIGFGVAVIDLIAGSTNSNPMAAQNDNCIISPKENIYFLRFNDISNDLNTHYMMVEGDIQAEYEPYGYKFYTNAGTGEFITGPEI